MNLAKKIMMCSKITIFKLYSLYQGVHDKWMIRNYFKNKKISQNPFRSLSIETKPSADAVFFSKREPFLIVSKCTLQLKLLLRSKFLGQGLETEGYNY